MRSARARARLAPDTKILADVGVKHAAALAHRAIEDEARDAVERGLADGIVVTGSRTGGADGRSFAFGRRRAARRRPVLLGSGLDVSNANDLLAIAAGAIVGTKREAGARHHESRGSGPGLRARRIRNGQQKTPRAGLTGPCWRVLGTAGRIGVPPDGSLKKSFGPGADLAGNLFVGVASA